MPETTFPCPACGAPVEPLPGARRMACPYCGVQAAIPDGMVRPPEYEQPAVAELPPARVEIDGQQVAEALRQARPVVAGAWNAYAWWTIVRRFIPGCAALFFSLCLLVCIALTVLTAYLRQR